MNWTLPSAPNLKAAVILIYGVNICTAYMLMLLTMPVAAAASRLTLVSAFAPAAEKGYSIVKIGRRPLVSLLPILLL